jgi:endonuclease/exonuclease/phosphatase (EEP) superfamily protein YafD
MATAGLALMTGFALAARLWWAFDLFSHFRLQYAILAAALCLGALALRAWPIAAVLAVIGLLHGWAMKDLWLGGSAATASGTARLRVASANVLRSNPEPEKLLDFVHASDADVLVLVEAQGQRWRDVLAAIAADYPHRAPQRWQDGAPVILFSRHPVLRESVIASPAGRRPYLAADLALGEHTLTVVGVHPSSPSPSRPGETRRRNVQLGYLANLVEDERGPMVVAGDFNTTPWSPSFRDLVARAGLRNAADGHGYIGTWPNWFWPAQIPIDHVLVKGPVAVADIRRGSTTGSDHYPVVADLRLMERQSRTKTPARVGSRDVAASGQGRRPRTAPSGP